MTVVHPASAWRLLPPPAGRCPLCASKHEPEQPHNATSLYYQMRFRLAHGRAANWADAMAHCDERTRERWRQELTLRGLWKEPPAGVAPIAEPLPAEGGAP